MAAGNARSSGTHPWPRATQRTRALLLELRLGLRASGPDGFNAWFSLGIERFGKPAVIELIVDWINLIFATDEANSLVGWHLGVSL